MTYDEFKKTIDSLESCKAKSGSPWRPFPCSDDHSRLERDFSLICFIMNLWARRYYDSRHPWLDADNESWSAEYLLVSIHDYCYDNFNCCYYVPDHLAADYPQFCTRWCREFVNSHLGDLFDSRALKVARPGVFGIPRLRKIKGVKNEKNHQWKNVQHRNG